MENVDKYSTEEIYVGKGSVVKLGDTEKLGAFIELPADEFMDKIDEEFAKLFESSQDHEGDVDTIQIHFKVLPMKPENVSDSKTHSVKMYLKLTFKEHGSTI